MGKGITYSQIRGLFLKNNIINLDFMEDGIVRNILLTKELKYQTLSNST